MSELLPTTKGTGLLGKAKFAWTSASAGVLTSSDFTCGMKKHTQTQHQVLRLCLFLDSKVFRFQAWCLTKVANSDVYRDGGSDVSEGMGQGGLYRDYVYSDHTLHHGGHTKHATIVPPRLTGMSPSPQGQLMETDLSPSLLSTIIRIKWPHFRQ